MRKVALYAAVEVQPLAAYFGGVVAQEVVKVCALQLQLQDDSSP